MVYTAIWWVSSVLSVKNVTRILLLSSVVDSSPVNLHIALIYIACLFFLCQSLVMLLSFFPPLRGFSWVEVNVNPIEMCVLLFSQDFREAVSRASHEAGKPVIEDRLLNQILYNLPQLYELNQDLLQELEQRVHKWYITKGPSYQLCIVHCHDDFSLSLSLSLSLSIIPSLFLP